MLNKIKTNRFYLLCISIICLLFTSTVHGLSDWDFIWQSYLGGEILNKNNFFALDDLIWGTLGVSKYIDHEWLTNIIFYIFKNIFGTSLGVLLLKLFLEVVLGISLCIFIKHFNKGIITNISFLSICFLVFVFSTCAMKPKAFIISVVFVLWLLIICEDYSENKLNFKWFSIYTLFLCLLWNNFHSGSIALFFILYGAYWLFKWRDKKILILGLVSILFLFINPYGLDLILFDIEHFSDDIMKILVNDWHYLDLTMEVGVAILLFVFIVFLHLFNLEFKKDFLYIVLFMGVLTMLITSMRHFIYLLPIGILIILKGQFKLGNEQEIACQLCTYFISVLTLAMGLFLFIAFTKNIDNFRENYSMDYIDTELENILIDTNLENNDGLFATDVDVWSIGLKSFYSGAFPHTRQRSIDGYVLMYGDYKQIENIIDYYGLTKFLLYNKYDSDTGYTLNTSLYDYLVENNNYIKLYDNDVLSYFVKK